MLNNFRLAKVFFHACLSVVSKNLELRMKISNNFYTFNNFSKISPKNNQVSTNSPVQNANFDLLNCQRPIAFGANVKDALQTKSRAYEEYLKGDDPSVMNFLKKKELSPYATFKFLCHVTGNKQTAKPFAREISANPRAGEKNKKFLIKKLGNDFAAKDMYMTWFHDENFGYRKAYNDYFYGDVWSSDDLMKVVKESPLVSPWAIRQKLQYSGRPMDDFTLGKLPSSFGDINTYRKLVNILRYSECDDVKIDGKDFVTKPFKNSFSLKKNCLVLAGKDENAKKYILKFDPNEILDGTEKSLRFTENQSLRPDMPYLDAVFDFYLKENNSECAPDIEFFDYITKSVLYSLTEGEEPEIPEKFQNNLYEFKKFDKVKDLTNLGIELNDVHKGNFKVTKDGKYKLIDSGHVKFSSPFRPPVVGVHIVSGNLSGREICR